MYMQEVTDVVRPCKGRVLARLGSADCVTL